MTDTKLDARGESPVRAKRLSSTALFDLLGDPTVTDVLVNGPGQVWREREGRLEQTGLWLRRSDIDAAIEQLLAASGRRVDRTSPIVDARLADGSRLSVVLPPIAVDGPCLSIRRFTVQGRELADFTTPNVGARLIEAVVRRMNIVVSGPTGVGKTSLLNALAAHIDPSDRIVTIEDAAELALPGGHVVRLESRGPSTEGGGRVTTADLVRTALRLRPDRIIVGECRGPEAHDMIQVMHTGHRGSLTTVHANSPRDAIERLAVLAASAGHGLGIDVARAQLSSAVELVVHLARGVGGTRRIEFIEELGADGGTGR
ncbi:MAG TPA: ATPase, T2SS/T4P/T4SS family [Acidimicrobiales bacterium]|nr:ATPase, T2SS/T4P/T4SS family [Acidimicrobiales bacterium]